MNNKAISILIVDDEEMVARMLKSFFEFRGAKVEIAHRGNEALEILSKKNFDAAIIDIRLPDMNGDDVILRAASIVPHVHYFIYTGSIDYHLPEKLREIGIRESDVIYKPIRDMNEIYDKIITRVDK